MVIAASVIVAPIAAGQEMNEPGVGCHDVGPDADAESNATYSSIRKILSPAEQEKLRTAQRLWLQFRDANCAAERDLYVGGSAAPAVYAACLAADTRQRTAELKKIYGWRLEK